MVSCELVGRMANQMFTIACTIATALRHGIEYHIPDHTLNDNAWEPRFTNLTNKKYNYSLPNVFIQENTHAYEEINLDKDLFESRNFIIRGYRQSEKYFKDYLPEVRNAFGFEYNDINKGLVGLHKRLADYKLYQDKHPIISDEYIKDSLMYMRQQGYFKCDIFSDEIEDCRNINNETYPLWSFRYSESKNDKTDFQRLLNCESFIISASTFSLMASILSKSEDKICIAPKIWFGENNRHLDSKDIVPENYIRL